MSGDFVVPSKSWFQIRQLTDFLRSRLGQAENPRFPIMEMMERVLDQRLGLFLLLVQARAEMGTAEGLTAPDGTSIRLREDVYEKAWSGEGRARFTAAHELGHWAMHTNVPFARVDSKATPPGYMSGEPQANQFAAELLMPVCFISRDDTGRAVAERCGVSVSAAEIRLGYLIREGLI
jgi:Zn-dependent peptidase ImmA (M78 family)